MTETVKQVDKEPVNTNWFPVMKNTTEAIFDSGKIKLGSGCITGEFKPRK